MFYIQFLIFLYWKMSEPLIFANFLFFGERCERFAHDRLFPLSDVSDSLRSLTKNERCGQIAQVAHQKWATMNDLLTSLRGNERSWANRWGRSPKMSKWVNRSFLGKKRAIRWENRWANSSPVSAESLLCRRVSCANIFVKFFDTIFSCFAQVKFFLLKWGQHSCDPVSLNPDQAAYTGYILETGKLCTSIYQTKCKIIFAAWFR